jgi:uncharacterized protein YjiS (DUF1127 family)
MHLPAFLRDALDAIRRDREIRTAIRELEALDDHALDDLGIRRDEIADYVTGRLRREPRGAVPVAPPRLAVDNRRAA